MDGCVRQWSGQFILIVGSSPGSLRGLVTKGLAKDVAKTRRAHVDAVLLEQSLQKRQGVYDLCDIEKLASVSKTRSRWTEVRARKLATGYQWE